MKIFITILFRLETFGYITSSVYSSPGIHVHYINATYN